MYKGIKELAKEIGVPHWRIVYAHEHGGLPEPAWIMGRRAYDEEAAQRVRQYFVDKATAQLQTLTINL